MKETILVINADSSNPSFYSFFQQILQYNIHEVATGAQAIHWLNEEVSPSPDLILYTVATINQQALDTVRGLRACKPNVPVVAMIPYGAEGYAARLLQAGASEFITRPVSQERLRHTLQMVLKIKEMSKYMAWLERKISGHTDFSDIIGTHPILTSAIDAARNASTTKGPVWIQGETGTETGAIARAIHSNSDRAGRAFVAVNCQLLTPQKVDAMIFGCADRSSFQLGKLREADQGTLLLEEIYDLPATSQTCLKEFIEKGSFFPQGSKTRVKLDVRIICVTSRSLSGDRFDPALLQQLQSTHITIPSLAERKSDIPHLVDHFVAAYAASQMKYVRGLTPTAMQWLMRQSWPGNVQQLSNLLWKAVMLATGEWIDMAELLPQHRSAPAPANGNGASLLDGDGKMKTLKSVQEEAIRFALQYSGGCMTRAAKSLGIGRSTLYRKLSEFRIDHYISRANQTTRPMMAASSMEYS